MRIYIAGICGTFMAGVARIATELGHMVGGCDASAYPPMSEQLEQIRISVDAGYKPEHIKAGWDCFIIGNALSRGNPLVEEILQHRLAYTSGPEWLAREVLRRKRVLAVAGTHGKTTTAAMLAWILDYAESSPGFLIGGVPAGFDISARAGDARSTCFVIEADEYDTAFFDKRPKFMHYYPEILVLNNLEFDHADIYESLNSIKRQFHFLLRTVPPDGAVLYRADDVVLREVLDMGLWSRSENFSVKGTEDDSDWFAEVHSGGFHLFHRGRRQGECRWSIPGKHNACNAAGAIAAAFHAGVEVPLALQALTEFKGVRRRLEIKSDSSGVVIYDDFAHHPTAISTSLETVASDCAGRVFAVLEPNSNTMKMGYHNKELSRAFLSADKVLLYHPSSLAGVVESMVSAMRMPIPPSTHDDADELLVELRAQLRPGDRVVFMSSGEFGGLPSRLARALQGKKP